MRGWLSHSTEDISSGLRRARTALSVVVCALFLLQSLMVLVPSGASEPTMVINPDDSRTMTWDLDNPDNFTLTNTVLSGGYGELRFWNGSAVEDSKSDFDQGINKTNIDTASVPGSMLIANGDEEVTSLVLQPGIPGVDAYIEENSPGQNFGITPTMNLNSESGNEQRVLVWFNLSSVPANAIVYNSTLCLDLKQNKGEDVTFDIHALTRPFDEATVSWNMAASGVPWSSPGGDYDAFSYYTGVITTAESWHYMEVSRLVDSWVSGSRYNYGFIMVPWSGATNSEKALYSSDEMNKVELRPMLRINYTVQETTAVYESKALGQGACTNFTEATYLNGTYNRISDEFDGTTLLPKWSWSNDPLDGGGTYDVGSTEVGKLRIVGEPLTDLLDVMVNPNFLYQHINGNFRMTTHVNTSFSASTMAAGLMLYQDDGNWVFVGVTGTGPSAKLLVRTCEDGADSDALTIPWTSQSAAYLRMDMSGTTVSTYYRTEASPWTALHSFTPSVSWMALLDVGPCIFAGGSTALPSAVWDFLRAEPFTVNVSTEVWLRLGNSTAPGDASWGPWTGPLASSSVNVIGRVAMYIQYRVTMLSDLGWISPEFMRMQVDYYGYAQSGTIVTQDVTLPYVRSWAAIVTSEIAGNGVVRYNYSIDHGATWKPLGTGGSYDVSSETASTIMIRIDLVTYDMGQTPRVDKVALTYVSIPCTFYLETPATVVAGEPFFFLVVVKDEFNNTMTSWKGFIDLHAVNADGTGPATTELVDTIVFIASGGMVWNLQEKYNISETIRIEATADGAVGLSAPITVLPGPVDHVVITPIVDELPEYATRAFVATTYDVFGNEAEASSYTWSADSALGTLNTTVGRYVDLTTGVGRQSGRLTVTADGFSTFLDIRVVPPMYPPEIVGEIPSQSKPEDFGSWTLNITSYVTDFEDSPSTMRWYITNEQIVTISGENKTGNMEITFSTKNDLYGMNLLYLFVVDSDGQSDNATIPVLITPVNDGPTIEHITPLVVTADVEYQYDFRYYIEDVDDPKEELSLSVDAASVPYTHITWLAVIFNYPLSMNGTQQYVVVTVSDGSLTSSTAVSITVSDDRVPVAADLPYLTMNQGETVEGYIMLDNYFTDPDGDVLFYASGYEHIEVTIQANHSVDFTAPTDWYGEEVVIFSATDPEGARAEKAMMVNVLHVNQPPSIGSVPNLTVMFETWYDFDLWPYIRDPDNAVETLYITTDDSRIAILGTVMSILLPESLNGITIEVLITVSDGSLSDSTTVNITITDNPPPRIRPPPNPPPPDHSFLEDAPTPYPVGQYLGDFFEDFEDAEPLTYYAFTSSPEVVAIAVYNALGDWWILFDPEDDYNGECYLTIRGTDVEGAIVEDTVKVDVIPQPDAPRLEIFPATFNATEGMQTAVNLAQFVTDVDGDDEFEYDIISGYSSYMDMHGSVLVFDFVDFLDGKKSITFQMDIRVRDPTGLTDTQTVTVTVTQSGGTVQQNDPWLYIITILAGVTAFGVFMFAMGMRKRPFVIRDMMLVHNDGFLISRYASHAEGEIDQDVLTAMLTAVLNFIEDSTGTVHEELKTFGFKDWKVIVERSKKTFAAIVYEGDTPNGIAKAMGDFLATVERVYKKNLASWSGDIETDFAGVDVLIRSFVKEHGRKSKGGMEGFWKIKPSKTKVTPKMVKVNSATEQRIADGPSDGVGQEK